MGRGAGHGGQGVRARRYPSTPCTEEGQEDFGSSEEEADCIRLLVRSKEGNGTVSKISSTFPLFFGTVKHAR